MSRVASTSRLVRIAVSGVRSSCDVTAAKSRAEASAALVRSCSSQMRCTMPLTASAISTASVAPRTSTSGASPPTSIARVCCASRLSGRTANAASSQPATAAAPIANGQMMITRRCRLLVSAMVRRRWRRRRPTSAPRHPDLHRADPVAHAVDVGVGVAGGQLGQDDVRVGRDLAVLAHRDDRRPGRWATSGSGRDRGAGTGSRNRPPRRGGGRGVPCGRW